MSDVFDARDPDPARRRLLLEWLAAHAAYVYHPREARERLAASGRPGDLLNDAPAAVPDESRCQAWLRQLARLGVRAVPRCSAAYPEPLARLSDGPLVLLVRGDVRLLRAPGVAVVGARAPTVYGRRVAHELGFALGRAGWVVTSGLARGIDAAAHAGALEAGGASLAFQGCGPDQVYPREHAGLVDRLLQRGGVATELPLGSPPRAGHFPLRNRLISAVSRAVVVVEARERSGSLVTAGHAADQGVEVFAVPGPITSPASRGALRLLREGAAPLTQVQDLLDALGPGPPPQVTAGAAAAVAGGALAPELQRIVSLLEREPLAADDLARRLGQPAAVLAGQLVRLELEGRVAQDRDGRLQLVSPLRGPRL